LLKKCPNNTESTGNDFVCKIIYKNKKDTNDKINIQLTIMITVASIIIIAIIIILINYFRKKLISRIYNPLVDNHDLITLILTSVNQQINLPITCRKTDIVNDILLKELSKGYPEYRKKKYYIICNGKVVGNNKSFEENNIKDKDILILNEQEVEPII
jgi:hypothetical protein